MQESKTGQAATNEEIRQLILRMQAAKRTRVTMKCIMWAASCYALYVATAVAVWSWHVIGGTHG